MVKDRKAYVDTSAFISFLDKSDTYNRLFHQLFSNPPKLVTTPLVIAEGHAWFLRRYDRFKALRFLSFIEDLSALQIVNLNAEECAACTDLIRKFSDQNLTLADALGLHIMNVEKIKSCWSTDHHLSLTGVSLVINEK